MSQIETEIILTFQPDTNPKVYGTRIIINSAPESSTIETMNHSGTMTEPNQLYTAVIDHPDLADVSTILSANFGPLNIHPETGEVEIILKNGGAEIDRKKVKVKEAQDESRPIGVDN